MFKDLDIYTAAADEFNKQTGIDTFDCSRSQEWDNRLEVIKEEVDELEELVGEIQGDGVQWGDEYEGHMAEELADILYTVFTCAQTMEVDIHTAFRRKHSYNMNKTGSEIVDGKVQDDADIEKPDFSDLVASGDRIDERD